MEMDDYFSSNSTNVMEIFFLTTVQMYTWDMYQIALKYEGKKPNRYHTLQMSFF